MSALISEMMFSVELTMCLSLGAWGINNPLYLYGNSWRHKGSRVYKKKKVLIKKKLWNKTYQNEITLKSYLHLYSLRLHCCNVGDSICGAHRRYNLKVLLVSMMRTHWFAASQNKLAIRCDSVVQDSVVFAGVLTLQPCGCLSGCAHRWRAPARVYPSDPGAELAPPAGLWDGKQGQSFKFRPPP